MTILDELDRRFEEARARLLMKFVDAENRRARRWPRVVEELMAADVLDNWLHGTSVHMDPTKAEAVSMWSAAQYEWSVIEATTEITHAVLATHVVVRGALGILVADRRVRTGPGVTATNARWSHPDTVAPPSARG